MHVRYIGLDRQPGILRKARYGRPQDGGNFLGSKRVVFGNVRKDSVDLGEGAIGLAYFHAR